MSDPKSQGSRFNDGKLPFDLIPPEAETAIATVLRFGAIKYGPRNWEKGLSWAQTYGALRRHLSAWYQREEDDAESGLPHLWHALTNLAFLATFHCRDAGTDDRPLRYPAETADPESSRVLHYGDF